MVHGASYIAGYIAGLAKAEKVARSYAQEKLRSDVVSDAFRGYGANVIAYNLKIKRDKLERS